MSRPPRSEKMAQSRGRPKRRAASSHLFKYQLAKNPSRAEETALKKALQESLEELKHSPSRTPVTMRKSVIRSKNNRLINSSTNSSDFSRISNNSSSTSNESSDSLNGSANKRTRASTNSPNMSVLPNKRAKLTSNGHKPNKFNHNNNNKDNCDRDPSVLSGSPLPPVNRAIRTYSRSQHLNGTNDIRQQRCKSDIIPLNNTNKNAGKTSPKVGKNPSSSLIGVHSPVDSSRPGKKSPEHLSNAASQGLNSTKNLSIIQNQNQANVNVTKKRIAQGSWSLVGVPEEKIIYLRDDEPARRLICYPAIKHVEGDMIQVRDSVLLRSGAKTTDLPYIAKVCAFWEDAETGGVMMSLFWYYRPEHTEEGRKPHHLPDEIFASRHRDVDSVECIEDKCYVLTFNEYCRYKKRVKMEQVGATWSLADVTIPVSNESYPRRNRIPDTDVNPELVLCCRQIYDSRMRRLIKNPFINPKYGHI